MGSNVRSNVGSQKGGLNDDLEKFNLLNLHDSYVKTMMLGIEEYAVETKNMLVKTD